MTFLIIVGIVLLIYAFFMDAGGMVIWMLLKWPLVIIAGIVGFMNITWWTNLLFVPAFLLAIYPEEKMPDWMGDFMNVVVAGAFLGFGYYLLTLFG